MSANLMIIIAQTDARAASYMRGRGVREGRDVVVLRGYDWPTDPRVRALAVEVVFVGDCRQHPSWNNKTTQTYFGLTKLSCNQEAGR